jgi:hypothetical protein
LISEDRPTLLSLPAYMSLLQWVRCELERIGNSDHYHYAFHEIEGLLLFDGGGGFGSPGIDFATQFEKNWALAEDLQTLASFVGASLSRRLMAEDFIDSADFPERLDASSPLRLLDFRGWQFFDRSEVAAMLGAVHKALEQKKELLYEEEWEELATAWRKRAMISRCSGGSSREGAAEYLSPPGFLAPFCGLIYSLRAEPLVGGGVLEAP